MSPLKSILFWSPKKALLNISPKIDNKCPVSPAREPKQIEGLVKFHTMTNKPRAVTVTPATRLQHKHQI